MKDERKKIPEVVVRRIPKYYKLLSYLESKGVDRISSSEMAEMLGITASQVRQDFSHLGAFGQQGYGYKISGLKEEIKYIVGLTRTYNAVIVGGGHIGQALANYKGFKAESVNVLAIFDIDVNAVKAPNDVPVLDVLEFENFVKENEVDICIITTNINSAEEIENLAKKSKIPAIWNFTHKEMKSDDITIVENVNLSDSIFALIFMMNNY